MSHVIVIGAGQAAASFAAKFRELDQNTAVTIIGNEPVIPYQRPPLSKKYATGEMELSKLYLRPESWYEDNNIDLKINATVSEVDRQQKTVSLVSGQKLTWDKLVFATGSRVRKLPEKLTKNLEGIHYLRNLNDADKIAKAIEPEKKVVIIGGGYIGLEAAAVFTTKKMSVSVVESANRILARVACKETASWFKALHESKGVTFFENAEVTDFVSSNGRLSSVVLSDGSTLEADIALVGIGVIPNSKLAQTSGLESDVSESIIVNPFCQTSDPSIYAAGDCSIFEYKGKLTRLESVPNAIDQAIVVAENIVAEIKGDLQKQYQPKPWFWSDQYNVKLQIAGLNRDYTSVIVRKGSKPDSVSHFYYQEDNLIAVDAINEARVYMICKRLLEAGKQVTCDQAKDYNFDLKSLL